jgi:hypothetical protein
LGTGRTGAPPKSPGLEPISPELALIDPEFARRTPPREFPGAVRCENPPVEGQAHVVEDRGRDPEGRTALPLVALLLAGLATSGFFAARMMAPSASTSPATALTTSGTAPASALNRSAAAQRQLLDLVMGSPPGRLPRELVDRKTGLPTRNLEASCRAAAETSFVCVVRPVQPPQAKSLSVRYRPGAPGSARLVWGGSTEP